MYCLVVDDSKVVRKICCDIVESLGFTTGQAEDGKIALEQCYKKIPDLILLDWNMPVMTGIEFLEQFRQLPGAEKTKVIFCTTENGLANIQQALSTGADEYVMKPFDKAIIEGKLQQVGLI
ncbi:MAG: response regulator [Alphaproteobacteria bacterium]|nr:response regulator [Alphaproteobacteria bacterium]